MEWMLLCCEAWVQRLQQKLSFRCLGVKVTLVNLKLFAPLRPLAPQAAEAHQQWRLHLCFQHRGGNAKEAEKWHGPAPGRNGMGLRLA